MLLNNERTAAGLTSGPCSQDIRPSTLEPEAADAATMARSLTPDPAAKAREPTWSGLLTRPMARRIPGAWRPATLAAIKGIHTAIFVSISAAVVLTVWDGLRGRPRRRTAVAGIVVLAESVLYVSNNQVCPLTPLAEEFGAERGSVVDLYLPAAVARQIPLVAGSSAALALVLNLRALRRRAAA